MAETKKSFSPEEKLAFEQKYNLGVYSHEAMIELLMQQQEMIMEIAKNINVTKFYTQKEGEQVYPKYNGTETLFDKWKSNLEIIK